MSDLGREIEAAVRVDWSDDRLAAARAGLGPRRRRRLLARVGTGLAVAVAVAVVVAAAMPTRDETRDRPPLAVLRFADGSIAVARDVASRIRTTASAPDRVVIELASGGARFDIARDPARVFRVDTGSVAVESFDAVFACSRIEGRTQVEVYRGTLRVMWGDARRELAAGERGVFPPLVPAASQPVAPAPTAPPPAPARVAPPPPQRAAVRTSGDSWRELARDGDFDRAYAQLDASKVPDVPEELLLAADVERLSHHPGEAVAPLRAVVRDHASDPRASLAAFTLGRVLLEELGRPAEAAEAFADAVRLAPDGPMAEDALAREVEALSRAGDVTAAKQLAERYLEQYPSGRKTRSVRRFGAIE